MRSAEKADNQIEQGSRKLGCLPSKRRRTRPAQPHRQGGRIAAQRDRDNPTIPAACPAPLGGPSGPMPH